MPGGSLLCFDSHVTTDAIGSKISMRKSLFLFSVVSRHSSESDGYLIQLSVLNERSVQQRPFITGFQAVQSVSKCANK